MKKSLKFPEELYISEIETWRKSSQLHADNAIKQYQKVTEGLEKIYFEKTRNEAILSSLSDGVIVFEYDSNNIIIFNKVSSKLLNIPTKIAINAPFDTLFETYSPKILAFVKKQRIISAKKRKRHIIGFSQNLFLSCQYDEIQIRETKYSLILLEDSSEIVHIQRELFNEKKLLEKRVQERTRELKKEISKKENAKRKAEIISLTDILTGLPNRRAFISELEQATLHNKNNHALHFSLLFIDLDGFKVINDTLGHYAGDVVLIEIAKRMKNLVRNNDFCARIGGDEFVIMLHGLNQQNKVIHIVKKLIDNIALPVDFNDHHRMNVTASIGVYLQNTDTDNTPSTILTMADEAMYEAKLKGRNCYVLFDEHIHQKIHDKTQLTRQLNTAMANNEFMVYFQPICDVSGKICGVESLARWEHNGQMISPAKFIPLLEQQGAIKEFTYFIMESVVITLEIHPDIPCISVNLSVQQFYDNDFIDFIDDIFNQRPNIKSRVNFEITESLFHKDPQALINGIKQLKERGFKVYIDDFGTGYSSFSYIRNFKADVIKIDRAFVIDIEKDSNNADLLKGMIALLQSMGLEVIIEGVENKQQIQLIKSFNTHVRVQGYYFYKPMPIHLLLQSLSQQNTL